MFILPLKQIESQPVTMTCSPLTSYHGNNPQGRDQNNHNNKELKNKESNGIY